VAGGLGIARINTAPIAIEAVKRIDALFAIEREINGLTPHERLAVRVCAVGPSSSNWKPGCASSAPSSPAKPRPPRPSPCLTRWAALTRFLDDGRLGTTPLNTRYVLSPSALELDLRRIR
jgi:transposase